VVCEPLHSVLGVAVPLGRPGRDTLFIGHVAVEIFREEVCTAADDETAIFGAVGKQVDETLEAAEARLGRVLVLVGPRLVRGEVGAAANVSRALDGEGRYVLGEAKVDCVK
jgi:hypothetical protein